MSKPMAPACERLVGVEDEAGQGAHAVGYALRVVVGVVVEDAHIAQLVGRLCRLAVLVVDRVACCVFAGRCRRVSGRGLVAVVVVVSRLSCGPAGRSSRSGCGSRRRGSL